MIPVIYGPIPDASELGIRSDELGIHPGEMGITWSRERGIYSGLQR